MIASVSVVLVAIGVSVWSLRTSIRQLITSSFASATGMDSGTSLDPAFFADGSCVAYGPTTASNHKTVFLDAGHGGIDPGGVGTTASGQSIAEAPINLSIELQTMELLRAKGYRVVVSRTSNSTVVRLDASDTSDGLLSLEGVHRDVGARDVCANLAGADALVGISMDASSSPQDGGSISLYDANRPFSAANRTLADLLQRDVVAAMNAQGWQIPDDGVGRDGGYGSSNGSPADGGLAAAGASYHHLMLIGPALTGYFSTPSTMPGAVIEPLYLTDPSEGSIAASSTGQRVIAQGLANAIEDFLSTSSR
jgi:N-acetylmuramoyl-L-alanine amidase